MKVNGLQNHRDVTVAIGFGSTRTAALNTATASLTRGFADARTAYDAGWASYLAGLRPVPASAKDWATEWNVSAMVLAASEDKTVRGGYVASPGRPWAWANSLQDLAVYHAVLVPGPLPDRDRAARRRRRRRCEPRARLPVERAAAPDGSFPQNSRLDGTPVFGDLQMDEVAFPIVLAHQLGRTGSADWARVKLSADYVVAHGPQTPQERWENATGWSPATIAAEIAGLVCAADIARKNGDTASASTYEQTADAWQQQVEGWTATTTGTYSADPYYLRITATGQPDSGTQMQVSDGGPLIDERKVVDPSFLDLVRLGVKRADDPVIRNSLTVVDAQLSYVTRNGRFWHRASFDGYGEKRDGTQWEVTAAGSDITQGRGWPLLGGERGEYALTDGDSAAAQELLDTMGRAAADDSHLMSEQVWDDQEPSGTDGFTPGEPTFSAMPLAWTHAQFLRLAANIDAGHDVETPQVVACRYDSEACTG